MYPFHRMNRIRGILPALWLAVALVLGQQAAQLHELGHAILRLQADSGDQHPSPDTCEKCSLYASFSSAAATFVATLELPPAAINTSFAAFLPAQSRTVVSSRSRAPPASL
jgi:hypothetical protein